MKIKDAIYFLEMKLKENGNIDVKLDCGSDFEINAYYKTATTSEGCDKFIKLEKITEK